MIEKMVLWSYSSKIMGAANHASEKGRYELRTSLFTWGHWDYGSQDAGHIEKSGTI